MRLLIVCIVASMFFGSSIFFTLKYLDDGKENSTDFGTLCDPAIDMEISDDGDLINMTSSRRKYWERICKPFCPQPKPQPQPEPKPQPQPEPKPQPQPEPKPQPQPEPKPQPQPQPAPNPTPQPEPKPQPQPQPQPDDEMQDLLDAMNAERAKVGAKKLVLDSKLTCAATRHSKDIGKTRRCSHTGSDGSSPWKRAEDCGTKAYGEIVACGQRSPEAAVKAWYNSSGHRKIMLDQRFSKVGLAMVNNYWTAIFTF